MFLKLYPVQKETYTREKIDLDTLQIVELESMQKRLISMYSENNMHIDTLQISIKERQEKCNQINRYQETLQLIVNRIEEVKSLANVRHVTDFKEVTNLKEIKGTKPKEISIGGKEYVATSWASVLTETCNHLICLDKEKFENLARKVTGDTRTYFKENCEGMIAPACLRGSNLYVETNNPAYKNAELACDLLNSMEFTGDLIVVIKE